MNSRVSAQGFFGKKMVFWFVMLAVFVAEFMFSAWCSVENRQESYEISQLRKNQDRLLRIQENLKIELESLKTPDRIAGWAKNELGLAMPRPDQIVNLP